jgi:hypothetical protein
VDVGPFERGQLARPRVEVACERVQPAPDGSDRSAAGAADAGRSSGLFEIDVREGFARIVRNSTESALKCTARLARPERGATSSKR